MKYWMLFMLFGSVKSSSIFCVGLRFILTSSSDDSCAVTGPSLLCSAKTKRQSCQSPSASTA